MSISDIEDPIFRRFVLITITPILAPWVLIIGAAQGFMTALSDLCTAIAIAWDGP